MNSADFEYVATNVPGPADDDDDATATELLAGCACSNGGCSASTGCACLPFGDNYTADGTLVDAPRPTIIECSATCACSPHRCPNRVVQAGVQRPLEVFLSDSNKGFGLRTPLALLAGTFVCEYAGEVLSEKEAQRRLASRQPTQANYLIVLNEHLSDGKRIRTCIDPERRGNLGRFANHSCEPNLRMIVVRYDVAMPPHLGLFCARDVEEGEELCFDYAGAEEGVRTDEELGRVCLCGERTCRGTLPFDQTLLQ